MIHRILLAILAVCIISSASAQNIARFYVAPSGKAGATGTLENPFGSLPEAIKKAHEVVFKGAVGIDSVEISMRAGTYYVDETIEIVEGKTWNSITPLTVAAYKNEKVILHGGRVLPVTSITKVTDADFAKRFLPDMAAKIREIDLKKLGIENVGKIKSNGFSEPYGPSTLEFFVNGKAATSARWPNNSFIMIDKLIDSGSIPRWGDTSNRGGKFTYAGTNRPSRWKEPQKTWIYGFFMWGYADETVPLKNIDTLTKTITTAAPSRYGFGTGKPWRSWYAYNVPEEIDTLGEYYLDETTKKIYFLPPASIKSLEVSILETPVMAIEGVRNVSIKNLSVTCSRGMGISMMQTVGVRIKGCTFSNLGMMAVFMGKGIEPFNEHSEVASRKYSPRIVGNLTLQTYENTIHDREAGSDNGVIDCEVYQTGAGGIFLCGGNRLTLEPGNNFAQNCRVNNFNRIQRAHRPGIFISGVGNRISNCEVFEAPSLAILLLGNNHVVEYNNVHDVALEVDDMGAFYNSRDPTERGNILRYNYFHHIGSGHKTMGVYHDDGSCGFRAYGNVFYKAGTVAAFISGGSDFTYTNNIFIDTKYMTHIDERMNNWAKWVLDKNGLFEYRLNLVNSKKPPYSVQYPEITTYLENEPQFPKRDIFTNNLLVNIDTLVETPRGFRHLAKFITFTEDNLQVKSDPGFVSYKNQDFRIKQNSEVWKKLPNFKQIPFEKIGYRAPVKTIK